MAKETAKMGVIVIDVQADFTRFKKGSLAVEGTDQAYVKAVEESVRFLKTAGVPVYATQDWHPRNHASFFTSHPGQKAFDVIKLGGRDQVLWPPHCVQNTPGAELLVNKKLFNAIVHKGTDSRYDSYSGFRDDGGKETEMDSTLKKEKIKKLVVFGIAIDYCVKATALDAVAARYKVILIKDLSRGVSSETSQNAIEEMKAQGVVVLENLDTGKIKTL